MKKMLCAVVVALSLFSSVAFANILQLDLRYVKVDVEGDMNYGGFINVAPKPLSSNYVGNIDANSTINTTLGYIPVKGDTKLDIEIGNILGPNHTGAGYGAIAYHWDVAPGSIMNKIGFDTLKGGIGLGWDFIPEGSDWKDHALIGFTISTNLMDLFVTKAESEERALLKKKEVQYW